MSAPNSNPPVPPPVPDERRFWIPTDDNESSREVSETELKELVDSGFDGPVMLQGEERWKTAIEYGIRKFEPYSVFRISNWFIKKGNEDGAEMTPMRLLKLVFFSYAWYLTLFKKKLFVSDIEAWKYGPVIPSLYYQYKVYGDRIVPLEAQVNKNILDKYPIDNDTQEFLETIYDKYRNISTLDLSAISHNPGSPWSQAIDKNESYIDDEKILNYYGKFISSDKNE